MLAPTPPQISKLAEQSRRTSTRQLTDLSTEPLHPFLKRRLTAEVIDTIIAPRKAGEKAAALCEEYGISLAGLNDLVTRVETSVRTAPITPEDIDVVNRTAVLGVRGQETAGTASDFLDDVVTRMPFPVQAIQEDGGSEFMAEFEQRSKKREIAMYVLPSRSPKLNGRVEQMNGICRREFWGWFDGELDLAVLQHALRVCKTYYNTQRLHQALGYVIPAQPILLLCISN